ncbi:MAG: YggS family pyridoxal phosphate-dependent enzyme [Propionibacteriaceae bacterium]|nr:YggS family pyridoxal phosphate-dependent enzyme [Propionibacteriaceae bacterium]
MTDVEQELTSRYHSALRQIVEACHRADRDPVEVSLLPVSKNHPASMVAHLMELGPRQFGENRVQEMAGKAAELGSGPSWVLIGHLQRNKVAQACSVMSELQSLDSIRLAQALERHLGTVGRCLPVLVEVNTSGEATKSGVDPDQVMDFTAQLRACPHLEVQGLMTVAHPDPQAADQGFARLHDLRDRLRDRDGAQWQRLSMGMTHDFASAIAHGSTCVRLGTAIFGPRAIPAMR